MNTPRLMLRNRRISSFADDAINATKLADVLNAPARLNGWGQAGFYF